MVPFLAWLAIPAPAPVPPPTPRLPQAGREVAARPRAIAGTATSAPRGPAAAPAEAAPVAAEEGVEGDVQDSHGAPASGASVTCTVGEREVAAETDAAGHFHLAASAAGCRAVASKQGFASSAEEVLRIGSGNRLRLLPPTGIAGTVVDEQGQPVMSYTVGVDVFRPAGGGGDAGALVSQRRAIDDAEGAFALTDLAPGHYELAVSVRLGPLARSAGVEVTPGAMTTGVRIVVHPGVTVTGTVTDAATHAPIDGAKAFVLWGGLSTRQPRTVGGAFTLEDAPSGRFDLRVLALGYAPKIVPGLEGRPGAPPVHVDVTLEREHEPGR